MVIYEETANSSRTKVEIFRGRDMNSGRGDSSGRVARIVSLVVVVLGLTPILIVFGFWIFLMVWIPRGAEILPYVSSRETERFRTSMGSDLIVKMNDAGAMHSGPHWIYVEYDGRIVAEGYPYDNYPDYSLIEWIDRENGVFRISLSQEERVETTSESIVDLRSGFK